MSATALKAHATGQAQQRPKTLWDQLENPRFIAGMNAVASKYLTADRMLRLCINAVKKTPRLLECDPQSVLGAMMASAALGLEPNTLQQQAFLIPYKKRVKRGNEWVDAYDCQFQVGARGFVTLAHRSPYISSLQAGAIHEHDLFEHLLGSQTFLKYAVNLKGRGDLVGAFSWVRLADDAGEMACVLPLDELLKIRGRSETFRSLTLNLERAENQQQRDKAQRALDETPWVMWLDDMATKSAIKKHAKQLPIAAGDGLAVAADLDARGDAGQLDLRALSDPDVVRAVVAEEEAPPALEHQPGEQLEGLNSGSAEAFGSTARQREAVPAGQEQQQQQGAGQAQQQPAQDRPAARRRRNDAPAPAAGPAQQGLDDGGPQELPNAAGFISRINDAADETSAKALLEQARTALTADEFARVEHEHRIAWTSGD